MRTIGIDLGTTHTVAAAHASLVPLTGEATRGGGLLPSIVAFPPAGGSIAGEPARARRGNDPANTISSAKRVIGRTFRSPAAVLHQERSAVPMLAASDGGVAFRTRAGVVTPTDIATRVLRELCTSGNIDASRLSAVVTVPVAFQEAERVATLAAVRAAGFAQARAIEEPVATALAYLARSSLRYAAVYDLGGGTFDVAILDCSRYPFTVVAHGGDAYLGGDDVDHAIGEVVADRVLRESGWDLRSDREVWERVLVEAERTKIRLSTDEVTSIDIANVDPAAPTQVSTVAIDRRLLRDRASVLIQRTFAVCDQVLAETGITARDVDAVFLAGGSTMLPGLRDDVREYFGKRARSDLDPMHVVAIGASLAAVRPDLCGLLDASVG
ncbi:MAG: Hsp70 family protein [Myxococcota bacterium]|nr:Hsp70 family protein [Myxococcota bacterium]